MSNGPLVIVDSREPKFIPAQLRDFGLTVVIDTLDAGDYVFFPHGLKVGIERKTVGDLLNSLRDTRMISQAHKMIDQHDAALLLIEGRYDRTLNGVVTYETNGKWIESGWSWDSFTGMMLDLKWMGLIHHQCMAGDSPREIARLVGSLSKDEHAWIRGRERPNVITIDPQYRNNVWGLMAFSGVGFEWAAAMLKHFGSFTNTVAAGEDQLAEVKSNEEKRFGLKRAVKLRKEWDEQWALPQ